MQKKYMTEGSKVLYVTFVQYTVYVSSSSCLFRRIQKRKRELSLESQIITIFVLINTLILYCYSCVRSRNLYRVVPQVRVKLSLTRIRLCLSMLGTCAIFTALMETARTQLPTV